MMIGIWITILSFIVNTVETVYFGFNLHPASRLEEQWDVACKLLLNLGVILMAIGWFNRKEKNNE